MSARRQDFGLRTYTGKAVLFNLTQSDGVTPLDITGWLLVWKLAPQPGASAVLQKNSGVNGGITVTNAALGQAQVQINGGASGDITDSGLYWHTLDGTPQGGQPVDLLEGRVIVDPSPIPTA